MPFCKKSMFLEVIKDSNQVSCSGIVAFHLRKRDDID